MKKLILIPMSIFFIFMVTGCFSFNSIEKFGNAMEDFTLEIEITEKVLDRLEEEKSLTAKDQKKIEETLNDFRAEMKNIKQIIPEEMVGAKKLISKIERMDDGMKEVQEKAAKGKATIQDIKEAKEILYEDINVIKLWE